MEAAGVEPACPGDLLQASTYLASVCFLVSGNPLAGPDTRASLNFVQSDRGTLTELLVFVLRIRLTHQQGIT